MYQYVPALHSLGIDLVISPLLRDGYLNRFYAGQATDWGELIADYLVRIAGLFRAGKFDLLWIEKELFPNFPAWFEQALAAMGVRYVIDIDDAVFHNYDQSTNRYQKLLAHKLDKVMAGSTLVLCGNGYLAHRARSAGAARVELLPTVIDLQRYAAVPAPERRQVVIGWCGSPSTVRYLEIAAPALQELSREFCLQLRVIGAKFAWDGIDVDCRPWSEDFEVREIQDFDLGIMPLQDTPWERGKCGYKLIQYMACGKPVVASSVGANEQIVIHGVNGYLASTPECWSAALRELIANPAKRAAAGVQGRALVEKQYCLQVAAPRVAEMFQECVGGAMIQPSVPAPWRTP
jgi:glycosyltransferase involved in cell wall biosynthesis